MGLCKCRKVTDLYCFVHKKPVCESCICTDHKVCIIGTYVQWLQDPEYDKPVCEICKGEMTAANVIRLLCLHMMHPECLDLHASSFPPNTAQAGFTCPHPNCKTPIVPTRPGNSTLGYLLYKHLENAPWLDSKSLPENHDEGPFSTDTVIIDLSSVNAVPSNETNGDSKSVKQSTKDSKLPAVHVIDMPGIASRKIQRTSPLISTQPENPPELPVYDDDEDKYNKHYVARLLNESPPVTASTTQGAQTKKLARPVRLTLKKLLIGFALISTLLIVILLSTSLE